MKKFIKTILITLLITISGIISGVNAADDPKAKDVIKGDGTLIPICKNGGGIECNLQSGGKAAGKSLDGVKDGSLAGGGFFDYVQDFIKYLLTFLTVLGVIYIIYAGLLLLTSAGEEEKMTQARKNIFYVMIGITVIYLAYPIVSFVVKAIS